MGIEHFYGGDSAIADHLSKLIGRSKNKIAYSSVVYVLHRHLQNIEMEIKAETAPKLQSYLVVRQNVQFDIACPLLNGTSDCLVSQLCSVSTSMH